MSPTSWSPTSAPAPAPSPFPSPIPFSVSDSNSKQISGNLNSRSSYQLIITANGAIYCPTACLPACLAWLLVAVLHALPETELPCVAYPTLPCPTPSFFFLSSFLCPPKKIPKVNAQLDIFNTRQQKANCTPYAGVPGACRGQQGRGGAGGERALSQGVSW